MICGLCAVGRHNECNGLCRATYEFCACADRNHQHPVLVAKRPDAPAPQRQEATNGRR